MNYNDLTDPYEIAKFIRDSVKTTRKSLCKW